MISWADSITSVSLGLPQPPFSSSFVQTFCSASTASSCFIGDGILQGSLSPDFSVCTGPLIVRGYEPVSTSITSSSYSSAPSSPPSFRPEVPRADSNKLAAVSPQLKASCFNCSNSTSTVPDIFKIVPELLTDGIHCAEEALFSVLRQSLYSMLCSSAAIGHFRWVYIGTFNARFTLQQQKGE
ncbi:Hypothetical predicted protein [Pelobates cultripes]|uniref:Uncharacterized protein n=1 Tax=Pelobates cultripes TaxID=61616 RepID=A0AAD1RZB5_PELCU|nr:Hypothetical predicted protein [Pelobates cultripes]